MKQAAYGRRSRRGQSLVEFVLILPLLLLLVLGVFEMTRLIATYTVITDLAGDTARLWAKPAYHAYTQANLQEIIFDSMTENRIDTTTTVVTVATGASDEPGLNFREVRIEYTVQPIAPVRIGPYEIIDPSLSVTAVGYYAEEAAFY